MRWSGDWHIVNTATGESLESHYSEGRARYFCDAVNEHEIKNNRPAVYKVEERKDGLAARNVVPNR